MGSFQASIGTFVGDSGSGGQAGLVPAPATGDAAALKFLKANGTWSATPTVALSVAAKTVAYTTVSTDAVLTFNMSGSSNASYAVTLLTAVGNTGLVQQFIVTTGTGILSVNTTSGQTISGFASGIITLSSVNDLITVVSNGTNWQITDFNIAVAAKYTDSAGTNAISSGAGAIYKYATKVWDTHNCYNTSTGNYTVIFPGKYSVKAQIFTASITLGTAQVLQQVIQQNGSGVSVGQTIGTGGTSGVSCLVADDLICAAGDTISILNKCQVATTSVAATTLNWLAIERVAN